MLRLLRRKPYLHLPYKTATTSLTPRRQSPPLVTDPTLTLDFLQILPNLRLLRILLPSEANLLAAVCRYPSINLSDLQKFVPVQTKLLLDTGLSLDNILKLITLHPRCSTKSPKEFLSCVAAAKEMGINPSHSAFVHACKVISKIPKPMWESRIQNLERLGWSRDRVYRAFVRHPYLMSSSEEKVEVAVEFFGEKLNWGPERLSESLVIISHSFEKRISPRYRLVKLLVEIGLWKRSIAVAHFMTSEKKFLDLYVAKYQEMVPEILEALGGNLGEKKDLNFVCEKVGGDDS
ncbi:hypothetical protein KSP40_PGU017056 [Platanthera guangdongensis]|uniref:Uncharacterized protein n=1 Tax=Platanthera guangdongensis TaxID=2320717 RepID=A0ABR2MJW1_9ASPA